MLKSFSPMPFLFPAKKKLDQQTLDDIIWNAGYSYDPQQDIFYSNMNPWQRSMGYCRMYDEAAIASGMIIDCEPIKFIYGGKRWLIEFWKGQYGMTTGFEIGVYNTDQFDLTIPEIFTGTFYYAAGNQDLLVMTGSLKKDGQTLFSRKDRHWWLTGFRLGEFSEPEQLVLDLSITLKDREMKTAFVNGLFEAGYSYTDFSVRGNTVYLRFDIPRTFQPITRNPVTDWITQRKNERLCKKYREITDEHNTLLDKMNAVLEWAPEIWDEIIRIGKNKPAFDDYRKIKQHTKETSVRTVSVNRVSRVFKSAKVIPFDDTSKFILMCDCHRGNGSWGDDFSRNRNLYKAALNYYYRNNFTYIEIGDGEELWENKHINEIINIHRDVYGLLAQFFRKNRLYFIWGNHDMVKKDRDFVRDYLFQYFDEREKRYVSLFEGIECHEGLVLEYSPTGNKILLVHGHQIDFFNYTIWKTARFLARYLWRPLNIIGVNDPTSAAKNYKKKEKIEKRLTKWVRKEKHMLISGHTHRPMFPEPGEPPYFNGGSSVHPQDITGIEIENGNMTLIKWNTQTTNHGLLFIQRDIISGPEKITDYFI